MPTHNFNMVVRYQRLDELAEKIDDFSYRVLKDDCLDLPEKIYQVRNVPMTTKQLEMYMTMKRMAIAELGGERLTALSALTQILRLHQIVCGHVKLDNGEVKAVENNRIKELMNILEETSGKVLIWANYRHDIQTIAKEISKVHGPRSVATFYGDTSNEERQRIIDEFQNEEELRYFVANPKTGGYGLTLTRSHTVVYYSNSYDLEVRLQSEDRVHRIGQTSKVTYVDLVTEGTVDEKIVQSLRNKINIATQVMGEELKQWLI
jgi:SNF2 family DNA or RNA helicase